MKEIIEIIQPDDWHVHLREGRMLKVVSKYSARINNRCIVMPNLEVPITTSYLAKKYKSEIQESFNVRSFIPLIPCYLTDNLDLKDFKDLGLKTLPGTAAEILDDEVRQIICKDKINSREWLEVMESAHEIGINSTATIMIGHIDKPLHWARHLIKIRDLQNKSMGFTEFVPLPFVPMEAPMFLRGKSRFGPTLRESVLMHSIARLSLHPNIKNIQTSWVKMGPDGVKVCLKKGVNDLGGTLMNESITRAAGAVHGQEMSPQRLEKIIRDTGLIPRQRTTLYSTPDKRKPTMFTESQDYLDV